MIRAAGSVLIGIGVTVAGAFANSLGLSVGQQRVVFALGVLLIVGGVVLFAIDWRRGRGGSQRADATGGNGAADGLLPVPSVEDFIAGVGQRDRRIKELEFETLRKEMQGRSAIAEIGSSGPHGHSSVPSQNRRGKLVKLGTRPLAVCVRSGEEKVPFEPAVVREPPATVDIGWGGTVTIRSFEDDGIVVDEANALPKQTVLYEVIESAPDDDAVYGT